MSKIIPYNFLANYSKGLPESHHPLVLVTGVFDLLHRGHRKFLKKAKAAGNILVVGIESDKRVKELKGKDRPIQPLEERLEVLSRLIWVDKIFALPETFNNPSAYRELLALLRPNKLAVSSHSPYLEVKQALMEEIGGEVVVVMDHDPTISTTLLVNKQQQMSKISRKANIKL